jgi:hypothetical protein
MRNLGTPFTNKQSFTPSFWDVFSDVSGTNSLYLSVLILTSQKKKKHALKDIPISMNPFHNPAIIRISQKKWNINVLTRVCFTTLEDIN